MKDLENDPFDFDDDIEVIENPYYLGFYQTCDQLGLYLEQTINEVCLYDRLFLSINGQNKSLSSIALGLGTINDQSLAQYLSNLKEDPQTITAIFDKMACGGDIIKSTKKYFVILDPKNDPINLPDPENNYIPLPNECFMAFTKPILRIDLNGQRSLEWVIDNINDVDYSGKGIKAFKKIQHFIHEQEKLLQRKYASK